VTVRSYASPAAFKQALEQRLRAAGPEMDVARRRQLLVFDRFLARVTAALGDAVTLKGGLVLELRLERARTTRDVDLRLVGAERDLLPRLQEAGRRDLGDFLSFEIAADAEHPEIQSDALVYPGRRFRAEGKLAGKLYGQPFGVDIAFGDPIHGEPELRVAEDLLGFAGIAPPTLRLYPIETHVAEKLHAYTMPRLRPNSRVKDLPDIALLASAAPLSAQPLRAALEQTFSFRNTHPLPPSLPSPPPTWTAPYAALAIEDHLPWPTLPEVTAAARAFLDPILSHPSPTQWLPHSWSWRP
jgi:hypothetical protein